MKYRYSSTVSTKQDFKVSSPLLFCSFRKKNTPNILLCYAILSFPPKLFPLYLFIAYKLK